MENGRIFVSLFNTHTYIMTQQQVTDVNLTQKAKIGVDGSLFNQLMSNNNSVPVVGEGATEMHYTDRTAWLVVEVSEDFKTVKLQQYKALKKGGESFSQDWELVLTETYMTIKYERGAWYRLGTEVVFTKDYIDFCKSKGHENPVNYLYDADNALFNEIYGGEGKSTWPTKVVDGITKAKVTKSKVNILFGHAEHYYDWSF